MFDRVTQQLAEIVVATNYNDLPQEVIDKIKLMLLDNIGCALGGYITDRAKIALELVDEFGGNPQASIIGNHRNSCALAAFANGELINALDYNCLGPLTAHVGAYVTSPCLAIAERQQSSGKELILALAIAHEVGGRAVSSLAQHKVLRDEPPYYEESPRFSPTSTSFGAVAGAGKLLKFNIREMCHAFGIVGASTPVPAMMKWENTGSPAFMLKYNCWTGWISQLAVVAALAAKKGFTSDNTILDGEWGFWKIVGSPFFKMETLLGDLGKVWHIGEVKFKPYPCCGMNNSGVEAINKIVHKHSIKPDDIEEIVVKGDPLMQAPCRVGTEVESFADTQFRNAYLYSLAAYCSDSPSPAWQMPVTFNNPKVKKLSKKVRLETHPRMQELSTSNIREGRLPIFLDVVVEVRTKQQIFAYDLSATKAKGSPSNPMTEAELVEKFRNNASYSMIKSSKVDQIIEVIKQLETVTNITELARLIGIT